MPVLSGIAARSRLGRAPTIPPGMLPASDIGLMSILGYDPARFHTGRAPIEAAGAGIDVPSDRIVFRCNLVTLDSAGSMVDFAGGRPAQATAEVAMRELNALLGGEV